MAYGTMGGDGQPQTQAMLFARHVLHRQALEKAIDAPRWLLGRTWGSTVANLRMEFCFDGNLVDRLSAGHDVEVLPEAYSDTMGHAGAVVLHPGGTLEGAHDPVRRRRRRSRVVKHCGVIRGRAEGANPEFRRLLGARFWISDRRFAASGMTW